MLPCAVRENDMLKELFAARQVALDAGDWEDSDIDWSVYDMVLLPRVHTYVDKPAQFIEWLNSLDQKNIKVENSPRLIRWNMDKSYMVDLMHKGLPVVDTVLIESNKFTLDAVADIVGEKGWEACVVKPSIGSDSRFCYKLIQEEDSPIRAPEDIDLDSLVSAGQYVLVQEYIPSITSRGEWSVVMIDGKYSHTCITRTPNDDFRTGLKDITAAVPTPPEELLSLAHEAVGCLPETPLYGRIDAMFDEKRQMFVVSEIEIIEPTMSFTQHMESFESLVSAVERRLILHM